MLFILGFISLILALDIKGRARKWCFIVGLFGVTSPVVVPLVLMIISVTLVDSNTPFSYWLNDRAYFSWFKTVGNPSFHEVTNQKGEVKEVFGREDVISARQFQLEILETGYEFSGKYKKDIDEFLENDGVNGGKKIFVDKYCLVEFKITNLVTRNYRVDGRLIRSTKVENENHSSFNHITFYPSNNRNNRDMNNAGQWKTGVVAFACEKTNRAEYLISFSSCSLRGGCGDENENDCLGNLSCPYKSYEEYIRDIKFKVLI